MRSGELGTILLEGRIVEHGAEEVTTDGECRAVALTQHTSAEVDGAILAAHPSATNQLRRGADEPGIGVIIRRTGLTTEVGIGGLVVAHESHEARAGAAHAALEQLLHEEGGAIRNGLLPLGGGFVDDIAIAILNTGHEHWIEVLTIVHGGAIGIDHLEQIDIAGAQRERRGGVELRLDTHGMGGVHDIVDAALLTQANGYGVDTHGEGLFQRDVGSREAAVGIGGRPGYFLTVIHHLHGEELVLTRVARGDALIHGFGVNEELKRRAGLAHGGYLIILPRTEIDIAHPGFDMTGLGLHSHEAAMHEVNHIADGVHRGEFLLHLTMLIVEHLDGVGQIEVVVDGVLVAIEFLGEVFVDGLSLGDVLDEVLDLHVVLVLPGIGAAPVGIEGLLHLFHLLDGCLFGIFLHARIDGGVDLQSFGIEGVAIVEIVLAPAFQIVGHSLAEVVGIAIVGGFDAVVEFDVDLLERVALGLGEVVVLAHEVEHDVTTLQRVVGIDEGIIIGGGLEHAYEDGGVLGREVLRLAVKVGLTSGLDAEGVRAEIDRVGILREDFVLGEEELELIGRDPLLALEDEHLDAGDVAQQSGGVFRTCAEQVLGQLLGDGGCTTRIVMKGVILQGSGKGLIVDTMMAIEALVLGIDEGFPEYRVHLFVSHRRAVLAEEFADEFAIGAIDHGSLGGALVLDS